MSDARHDECWCDPSPAKMATIVDHLVSRDAGDALRVHGGYVVISVVIAPENGGSGVATTSWQVPIDGLPEGAFQPPNTDIAHGTAIVIAISDCALRCAKLLGVAPRKVFGAAKQFTSPNKRGRRHGH